ncbi:MAG: hypothetical protein Q8K43_10495 [Sulfurimicrobium sp.]|nr:hypothetical protein [Gallionella sp.]MDP1898304.1 hypothetical protein [Sulfurimicrobium sp.]
MSHQGQTGARPQGSRISPRTVTIGLRQRAWWVMRRRVTFTLPELLATLADGTERDAISNLGKYVRALEKSGLLMREAARKPGSALTSPGSIRYRLMVDVGRQAPVWRAKNNTVYDPNKQVEYALNAEACDE